MWLAASYIRKRRIAAFRGWVKGHAGLENFRYLCAVWYLFTVRHRDSRAPTGKGFQLPGKEWVTNRG